MEKGLAGTEWIKPESNLIFWLSHILEPKFDLIMARKMTGLTRYLHNIYERYFTIYICNKLLQYPKKINYVDEIQIKSTSHSRYSIKKIYLPNITLNNIGENVCIIIRALALKSGDQAIVSKESWIVKAAKPGERISSMIIMTRTIWSFMIFVFHIWHTREWWYCVLIA